jgi:hypothetical protein
MSHHPTCVCGEPKKLSQVKKEGENNGKWFWSCPQPLGQQCEKSFAWGKAPVEEVPAKRKLELTDICLEEQEPSKYYPRSPSPPPKKADAALMRVLSASHEVQQAVLALVLLHQKK